MLIVDITHHDSTRCKRLHYVESHPPMILLRHQDARGVPGSLRSDSRHRRVARDLATVYACYSSRTERGEADEPRPLLRKGVHQWP
jgi:hypothetical protein